MTGGFEIGPYDPEYSDALAALWLRSWAFAVPGLADATPLDELTERFAREAAERWRVLVAFAGGRPAGFAAFIEEDGHLDQLFVEPSDQARGIGTALLNRVKEAMPGGVWLRTPTENTAACRFYERRGFVREKLGVHPKLGHEIAFYRWLGASSP